MPRKSFPFLSKEQYDRLSQAGKTAYLDRAIDAWKKLEAEEATHPRPAGLLPVSGGLTAVGRRHRS
jgi:hypothetical protein